MKTNEMRAIRLLDAATRGRFHIEILAGPANVNTRVAIMSALEDRKVPRAEAGINALERRLFALAEPPVACIAVQRDFIVDFCRRVVAGKDTLEIAGAADVERESRIDAERCTLQFGQKSARRLDSGKDLMSNSPLFGGPAQGGLFG
jgi:hypothetical protein